VTGRGLALLNASHGGSLRQLRLDGCPVCMSALASTVWHLPVSMCLWDAHNRYRGHLPRWVNIVNTLLWMDGAGAASHMRLRLWHAPEPSRLRLACMLLGLAGLFCFWLVVFVSLAAALFAMGAMFGWIWRGSLDLLLLVLSPLNIPYWLTDPGYYLSIPCCLSSAILALVLECYKAGQLQRGKFWLLLARVISAVKVLMESFMNTLLNDVRPVPAHLPLWLVSEPN
jgi:hypothetical protein